MQPEQQPIAQQPVPQQQAPVQPLAQFECWYIPEGKYTIFNYRKCMLVLYPGWMIIYRISDNVEVGRFQLAPDLRMKYFLSFVRVAQLNGRKYSFFKLNNNFITTPMWMYGVFAFAVVLNLIESVGRLMTGIPNQGLRFVALFITLIGFGLLATGMPKAKAIVEAAKRAAGIAS